MSNQPQNAQIILQDIEALDAYLQAALDILHDGHMPDVANLGGRVSALCTTIGNSDLATQQECLAKLHDLLAKLNVCQDKMIDFHKKSA